MFYFFIIIFFCLFSVEYVRRGNVAAFDSGIDPAGVAVVVLCRPG